MLTVRVFPISWLGPFALSDRIMGRYRDTFKPWSSSACFPGCVASVSHSSRQRSCSRWYPLLLQFARKPQVAKPVAHRYNSSYIDLGSQGSLALRVSGRPGQQEFLSSRQQSALDLRCLRPLSQKAWQLSGTLLGSRSVVSLLWFFISSVLLPQLSTLSVSLYFHGMSSCPSCSELFSYFFSSGQTGGIVPLPACLRTPWYYRYSTAVPVHPVILKTEKERLRERILYWLLTTQGWGEGHKREPPNRLSEHSYINQEA